MTDEAVKRSALDLMRESGQRHAKKQDEARLRGPVTDLEIAQAARIAALEDEARKGSEDCMGWTVAMEKAEAHIAALEIEAKERTEVHAAQLAAAYQDVSTGRMAGRIRQLEEALQWALDEGGWRLMYHAYRPIPDVIEERPIGEPGRVRPASALLAQPAPSPEQSADAMVAMRKWPPEIRRNGDGTVDEIVAEGGFLHMEQMDDGNWWFGLYPPSGNGDRLAWDIHSASGRAKVICTIIEEPGQAQEGR